MAGVLRAKHEDRRSNAKIVVGLIYHKGVYQEGNKNNTSYKTYGYAEKVPMKLLHNKMCSITNTPLREFLLHVCNQ
jgi:hypothetical protein